MFGDKVIKSSETIDDKIKTRGWFPRKCAVEILEAAGDTSHENIDKKKSN